MAISFSSASFSLANWGFSVGDIATIAGAGRKAGTWLLAHLKDRSLFEWMSVDVDAVCTRKGLVDTASLHKRWDQKFVLLKNGHRILFQSRDGSKVPLVQQMDRFTWLMTLFTATLDSAMETRALRKVLTLFLLKLFEENQSGLDFLRQEARYHIEGWMSAACVRNISARARSIWKQLEMQREHHPGLIPEAEADYICQFMMWLVSGKNNVFPTPSTDILCLAIVLEELGMSIRTAKTTNDERDEGDVVVAWNSSVAPAEVVRSQRGHRRGMRIPLAHMEEVASLFHADRNRLRSIFEKGMRAVEQDQLTLSPRYCESDTMFGRPDITYIIQFQSTEKIPRLPGDSSRFVKWMFPIQSPAACNAINTIFEEINSSKTEQHNVHMLASSLESQVQSSHNVLNGDHDYGNSLVYLQAFFLGYWYQLLLPLLDTSQLSTQEAFGMWSWSDIHCVNFIRSIVRTCTHENRSGSMTYLVLRSNILKLVAYLFGGAEIVQANSASYNAVGILGKIPVLYSSLIRAQPQYFGLLCLLDIDSSCIPSNKSGIVTTSIDPEATPKDEISRNGHIEPRACIPVAEIQVAQLPRDNINEQDFSIHIEPDWEHDTQVCLVCYRQNGRIVHRSTPMQIDMALMRHSFLDAIVPDEYPSTTPKDTRHFIPPENCQIISLRVFEGGRAPVPEVKQEGSVTAVTTYSYIPAVVNARSFINAAICLTCMYDEWVGFRIVTTQEQFDKAIKDYIQLIIVS